MNFSNYRFTLDIQKAGAQISIPVRYRDTGHMLYITLADGGQPYTIADGCRVDLCVKKPNGSPLINACYIEDNTTVRYDFNAHTANVAGVHYCEVRIIDEMERVITSPSFIMVVDERVVFDDDIITEEDRDTLLALDVIASEADRRSAEFDREENEQLRSVAEDEREGAEIARVTAENARVSAENARKSAESARVSAENTRKSAETAREQKFSQFDSRITGIERYLGGDNFIVDDSTAYEKTVPKNACEKAKVLSIGGMTYKKKTDDGNLMPYPYVGIGGLSYKVANGAITVTSGEETDFIISSGDAVYPAGTYVFEVGEQDAGYVRQIGLQFYGTAPTVTQLSNYKCQFTATSNFTITRFTARFSSSYNAQGEFTVTLHPMLYPEDKPITWQPRGYYMSHTKVKAIESKGANLAHSFSAAINVTIKGGVVTQISADTRADFTFKCQTYIDDVYQETAQKMIYVTGVHSLTFSKVGAEKKLIFGGGGAAIDTTIAIDISDLPKGKYTVSANFTNITQGYVSWRDIMLNEGENAIPYTPYVGTIDTFTIPEAVLNRDWYGAGTLDGNNHIYYADNGKVYYSKPIKVYEFTGDEDLGEYGSTNDFFRCVLSAVDDALPRQTNALCSHLPIGDFANSFSIDSGITRFSFRFAYNFFVSGETTTAERIETIRQWLRNEKAKGTPVTTVYLLEFPPIDTDITDLMPKENLIKVLGGCRIVAENEQSNPVPFSIKYLVTYQKEDA